MSDIYKLDFELPLKDIQERIDNLRKNSINSGVEVTTTIQKLEDDLVHKRDEIYKNLSRWERVQLARHPNRPYSSDYISYITSYWFELHGDKLFADDPAIIGGIGIIDTLKVVIIGQQKGRGTKEKVYRNFGMPKPEGYRKALRLMKHANRFNLPILTFIDTPGAYAGLSAEEQGQGEAIARNLREMFGFKVPIIATVIGEGGSGGALGIGVADKLLMFEHSVYTVASPEACASILWRDAAKAPEAASALKITGEDLLKLGIIDEVLPEPAGGNNWAPLQAGETLKNSIEKHLDELLKMTNEEILEKRYSKFRVLGKFIESVNLEEIRD